MNDFRHPAVSLLDSSAIQQKKIKKKYCVFVLALNSATLIWLTKAFGWGDHTNKSRCLAGLSKRPTAEIFS